jgi:hypothetical protein
VADSTKKSGRRPPKRDVLDRGVGFIQTSRLVAFDPHLTDRGVRVYMAITDHCWDGRTTAFPSQRSIAGKLSCSIDKVQDGINELRARGLLFVSKFGIPARNRYHFIRPDLVYSPEEMAFMADRAHTAEEWEHRPVSEPKPYEPPEETDDPDEGYATEERKSNEVPDAADLRCLGAAYEPHLGAAQDRPEVHQILSLRERMKQTKGEKEPRSAKPTLSGLSQDENHPEETRKTRSIPEKLAEVEEVVPGRERTCVSPSLDEGYNESDVASGLYSTNGQERSYGKSPSGVHEGFAEVTKPAPRTPPRGSQVSSSPYDVPSSPRPSLTVPKDEEPTTQAAAVHRLYGDWRTEVVARFKGVANDIPLKVKWGDHKLRACVVTLLSKFEGPTADGQPGYASLLRLIRVAAWDWEAVKVHEGAKWCAKGSPYPTLREIHLLSDFLLGFTATGVTAAPDHRVSNYYEQFLAKRTPEEETDEIGRIAKQEKKTRAAVIREMQAGRKPG